MKDKIERRELIVLDTAGAAVRGTYHRAYDGASNEQCPVGVYFLNSLSPTRAANGDSAVYWADSFAEAGYPSFRLDLPGFGDSDGNPPPELLNFINTGGYAPAASAKAAELIDRFNLSGVIIVGLCAGAVSAIHTAAAAGKRCKGLVLLDPYFYLPLALKPDLWQKIWWKLTGRIARTSLGRSISGIYEGIKSLPIFRGKMLPPNANFRLLNSWKSLASAGLPILLFKAPHVKLRKGEFDYMNHILDLAGAKSRVVVKVIEGAGHTFSNSMGRTGVREHTEQWLNEFFPLKKPDDVAGNA
jgi:pimeloyl-ACP methyl ester carboxylesterase